MRRWLVVGAVLAFPVLAQAECGWLLMLPTRVMARGELPPLAQWTQNAAFDAARDCQAVLNGTLEQHWQQLGKDYATGSLMRRVGAGEYEQLTITERVTVQFQYGRCLPGSMVPVR